MMIRKQIYLQARQQDTLRHIASVRGISEAEVIREAIDAQQGVQRLNPRPDPSAWERALKLMRSTQGTKRDGKGLKRKSWRREDLYKERLDRYGSRSS